MPPTHQSKEEELAEETEDQHVVRRGRNGECAVAFWNKAEVPRCQEVE